MKSADQLDETACLQASSFPNSQFTIRISEKLTDAVISGPSVPMCILCVVPGIVAEPEYISSWPK